MTSTDLTIYDFNCLIFLFLVLKILINYFSKMIACFQSLLQWTLNFVISQSWEKPLRINSHLFYLCLARIPRYYQQSHAMFSYFWCFWAFKSLSKSTTLLAKLYHKALGVALLVNLISKIITYFSLLIKPHWQKAWSGRLRRAVGD